MIERFFLKYQFDTVEDANSFEKRVKEKHSKELHVDGEYTQRHITAKEPIDSWVALRILQSLNMIARQCGAGYIN